MVARLGSDGCHVDVEVHERRARNEAHLVVACVGVGAREHFDVQATRVRDVDEAAEGRGVARCEADEVLVGGHEPDFATAPEAGDVEQAWNEKGGDDERGYEYDDIDIRSEYP